MHVRGSIAYLHTCTQIVVASPLITVNQVLEGENGIPLGSGIWNPQIGDFQPLFIREVILNAGGYQSSPFPCDSNEITVMLQPNVDLISFWYLV